MKSGNGPTTRAPVGANKNDNDDGDFNHDDGDDFNDDGGDKNDGDDGD